MKLSIFNLRGSANGGDFSTQPSGRFDSGSESEHKLRAGFRNQNPGAILRNQMLNNLLVAASIIAGLFFLLGLPGIIQDSQWDRLAVYGLITISLLGLTLSAQLPYSLRSWCFLGLLLIGGTFMLAREGLMGNGRLLLLALPILAAFLMVDVPFARIVRFAAWGASLIVVAVIGLLARQGYLLADLPAESQAKWVAAGFGLLLVSLVGLLVFERYLDGQESNFNRLVDLERERELLSVRLTNQTSDLQHRLVQIRTAAEISAIISSLLEPQVLLTRVCELVKERFNLYYVGIFLIESGTNMAVLTTGTGEAGKIMLAERHRLEVGGDSMVGWATAHRRARIALDIGQEAVRFDNPHLLETRSELALPIVSQQATLGAMTIQSKVESAFDQDDIMVLQSVADSLASAMENARLFEQVQETLGEVSNLHRQYLRGAWIQTLENAGPQEYLYQAEITSASEPDEPESIFLPIRLREQVIGSLRIETGKENRPGEDEITLAEAVLSQTALALENARLLAETRQQANQEAMASSIATRIWSSSDIETIMRTALQELSSSLDVDTASIEIWPERRGEEA